MVFLAKGFYSLSPGGVAVLIISSLVFASILVKAFGVWRAERRLKKAINAINIGLPYG
tara:strand:+ start:270 stop:443 length:174 start_codon:yes stop_codon:yes gene_type:complete